MDTDMISVISFLRQHEKSIVSGSSKLSLTVPLLYKINYVIQEAEYNQIISTEIPTLNNGIFECFCNIINKAPKLMIRQKTRSENLRADISRFENLRYLELKNIPFHVVEGMKLLKHKLHVLVCDNVSDSIDDIFGYSDAWDNLHTTKLSYNNFGSLHKFYKIPYLQYLDLSHNRINGKITLETLQTLQYLNLSFNYLTSLPVLNKDACHSLKVIIINNNFIEDLMSIHLFSALETVDLSYNIITDHSALSPMVFLFNLRSIDLSNNPISYHPYHRIRSCSHINASVELNNFLLNGRQLNSFEKKEVFRFGSPIHDLSFPQCRNIPYPERKSPSIGMTIPRVKARNAVIVTPDIDLRRTTLSVYQDANNCDVSSNSEIRVTRKNIRSNLLTPNRSFTYIKCIKKLNIDCNITSDSYTQMVYTIPKLSEVNMTLQLTKNQLEYSGTGGNVPSPLATLTKDTQHCKDLESDTNLYWDFLVFDTKPESENSRFGSKFKVSKNNYEESTLEINWNEKHLGSTKEESVSSDETFDELFLVQRKLQNGNLLDIFVALDEYYIREINTENGRTSITWSFKSVESCEKLTINPPTIRLVFSRMCKESSERIYVMTSVDADKLFKKIRLYLEARSLNSMNQVVYRCLKCDSVFSKELKNSSPLTAFNGNQKSLIECVICGSALVVVEEDSLFSKVYSNKVFGPTDFSMSSLTETPYRKQKSLVKLIQKPETKAVSSLTSICESDIEVISNPSQNSIEFYKENTSIEPLYIEPDKEQKSGICCGNYTESGDQSNKYHKFIKKPLSSKSLSIKE